MPVQNETLSNEDLLTAMHKYVVVEINKRRYAINVSSVKEIITLPEITPVPDSSPYERGIIKLRDSIVRIVDTRKKLKQPTVAEEDKQLIELIKLRKKDYLDWLNEFIACVEGNRKFTLPKDPRQCAFGKWYASYEATSKRVAGYLSHFDTPHKYLHFISETIENHLAKGNIEGAMQILDSARNNEVKELLNLFDGFENFINTVNKEIGIIFTRNDKNIGISVDNVASITEIDPKLIEAPDADEVSIRGVARIGEQVYIILDEQKITDLAM